MKKIFRLFMVVAGVLVMNSCSSDYLNTAPTASTGTSTVFESIQGLQMAVNGIYKIMTQQQSFYGQGYNGEGTMKLYLDNYCSNYFNRFNTGMNIYVMENSYHINDASSWSRYPWWYYYRVIGNANAVVVYGPDVPGDDAKRDYLIAQAKVVRAYCYMRLSERFHYRWSLGRSDEVKNGNGLVLRLDTSTGPMGLSSAADTYAQIVKDLTEAISVLEGDAYKRNQATENYQVNKDVAYAVYARAALIKGDYATAAQYAQKARKDYPLMSNKDYQSGFNTPNSEWIWSSYGSETETMYYWSFFAYMGFEANTSACRNYPSYMSKELYDQIPDTDLRKEMFLGPQPGEEDQYNKTNGQVSDKNSSMYKRFFSLHPNVPSSAKVVAWHQMKFQSLDGVGVGHLNHFRASEMYLIEAECQYMMGNESAAQALLEELNVSSGRDPEYTCTKTGEELFAEIKKYRGIELWGEGFSFGDLKRWNDPINRKSFKDGGSSYINFAITSEQNEATNWWTSVVPQNETNYNPEI